MHVAVNASLLSFSATYRSGGISRYIQQLLANLAPDARTRVTAFVPDLPPDAGTWAARGLQLSRTTWSTVTPARRIAWEQVVQPFQLRRLGVDLLHSPGYVAPLLWSGRSVVTVCDMSFVRYPTMFNRANRFYLQMFARLSARRADYVLTISEHTRADVIDLLGIEPSRVITTYCGVDDTFRVLDHEQVAAYKARRGLPDRYILYLGTLEPRKNVPTLLRAFARLDRRGSSPPTLVLAGAPGWQYERIYTEVGRLGISDRVVFLGFVPGDEQALCYNGADLFVYPSLYEGFGLPVLEAMACGRPIVSSNAASLPEVVGDAGILVDPLDEQGLAEAMERVLGEHQLRQALGASGLKQAARFSWRSMAEQTLQVYTKAMAAPVRRPPRVLTR